MNRKKKKRGRKRKEKRKNERRQTWASLVGARGSHWPLESVSFIAEMENWSSENTIRFRIITTVWIELNRRGNSYLPLPSSCCLGISRVLSRDWSFFFLSLLRSKSRFWFSRVLLLFFFSRNRSEMKCLLPVGANLYLYDENVPGSGVWVLLFITR